MLILTLGSSKLIKANYVDSPLLAILFVKSLNIQIVEYSYIAFADCAYLISQKSINIVNKELL